MTKVTTWARGDRRQIERRTGERRQRSVAVAVERRRKDRRRSARRSGEERRARISRVQQGTERRMTPFPFSLNDAATIRERIETAGEPGQCPACNGSFVLGPPVSRLSETVREYRCRECNRALMISVR